jgi:uncharacterized membrane protein
MAGWLPTLQAHVEHAAGLVELLLEAASVLCVLVGLVAALRAGRGPGPVPLRSVRLAFGAWLALALELQVGADVVATIATPTFEALGRLAATTAIRTFLNHFLAKELEAAGQHPHAPAAPPAAPTPASGAG